VGCLSCSRGKGEKESLYDWFVESQGMVGGVGNKRRIPLLKGPKWGLGSAKKWTMKRGFGVRLTFGKGNPGSEPQGELTAKTGRKDKVAKRVATQKKVEVCPGKRVTFSGQSWEGGNGKK